MAKHAAVVAMFLLAGCSLQPAYERPALPTASAYPADTQAGDGQPATEIGWREFFADPRLQGLVATALENNRDLRAAVARIEEARAQYRIQRADQIPSIEATGSAVRSRTPVGSLGGGGATGVPGATAGGAITGNRFSVTAQIPAFELDFWGRVRSLSEAARASYLSTVAAQRAFRISLIGDVASAYLVERELGERIELAQRTLRARREGLEIAKLRLDAGVTSALDYRQTETLLTQAQTELAALQRQQAQNRNALELLVGSPLPADLPAPLPLERQQLTDRIAPGLPSDLLTRRPDVIAAEEQLRAANANIGAARAAFFPRISLTGALGFASSELDNLVGEDGLAWSFGPSLSLPIFNAGRNRANLDLAEARRDIAVANYERTVQTAFREVADSLAGRRWLAEQLDAQQRALAAQRDRAELARLRYRNGVANYLEVLDAERELFAAEQQLVQTRRELLANAVSLYVSLGGGLTP